MTKLQRIRLLLSSAAGGVLLSSSLALAATDGETSGIASSGIEEIIVTAEKRQVRLQRIPVAVSAYDSEALKRANVDGVADLQNLAPSLQFGSIDGAALISIRGIGTLVLGPGEDPGVALHMDGVYLARAQYHGAALFDIERVEVLRGPQGTVNGRNATGGAINIITKHPTDEFEGYANVSYGNYNEVKTSGAVSGSLVGDKILGRVAWRTENRQGYTPNELLGVNMDGANQQSVRAEMLARLGDRSELLVSVDVDHMDTDGFAYLMLGTTTGAPSSAELEGGTVSTGRAVSSNGPTFYKRDIFGATAKLTVDFDRFALTATSGYREFGERSTADVDGTSFDFLHAAYTRDQWQASQEINLTSSDDGPFKWLVGLYYLHEEQDPDETYTFPSVGFNLSIGGPIKTDSYAAYAQASYDLSDKLGITAGVRYTEDKKEASEYSRIPEFLVDGAADLDGKWNAVTPKVSIDYRPTENALVYASVSRGFRSGGFNIGGLQGSAFAPEFVWSYEAGLKEQFFDKRLTANLAVFRSEYTDMQVFQIRSLLATVDNAASSTIDGVELEITALLGDSIRLDMAASYLDATFDEFTSVDEARSSLGLLDLSGNQLPRAPKSKLNIGLEKQWEAGSDGTFTLRGSYHWTDDVYFSEFNLPVMSQPDVAVWNALATYETYDGRLRISAYAKNITDETIYTNKLVGAGLLGFNVLAWQAPPLTYGIQVGVTF